MAEHVCNLEGNMKEQIYDMYCILDEVSGIYSAPVIHVNEGCAVRWFISLINENKCNPTDYSLYYVGKYSMTTGIIKPKKKFVKKVLAGEKVEIDINAEVGVENEKEE